MTKRDYDNTKRVKRKKENREAVIRVMIEAMADGVDDISVADIAGRSGVSRRTVYGYFPDKAARIRAIDQWIDSQHDIRPVLPRSFDDIGDYISRTVAYMFENETVTRVLMVKGLARDVRSHRKKIHIRHLQKALSEKISDKKAAKELASLITAVIRADAVFDLRDTYGFSMMRVKSSLQKLVESLIADFVREHA